MDVRYGNKLNDLPPSGTLQVGRKVASLRAQGIDVINLGGGLPDPQPPFLKVPVDFPMERNAVGPPAGELDLREAIARHLLNTSGVQYDPKQEVVVTIGAKHGIFAALLTILEQGDEVIVFDPSWVTYSPSVELAGGVPVTSSLRQDNHFKISEESLSTAVTPKTRAIILNTPHNPTGRVFTKDEITAVAAVAEAHNLWVLSDESFAKFVFDDNEHISISQLAGMRQRTVVLRSFSKSYALPGCRVGYLAAPQPLCDAVARLNEHTISCVSPLMQHVALNALAFEPEWTRTIQTSHQRKRNVAHEMLSSNQLLSANLPEGTFYVFVNIEALNKTSEEFADYLLHEAYVAVTPGSAFGIQGEGFIRLNLVGSEGNLKSGLTRILNAL